MLSHPQRELSWESASSRHAFSLGLAWRWRCYSCQEPRQLRQLLDFLHCWCNGIALLDKVWRVQKPLWAVASRLCRQLQQLWMQWRFALTSFPVLFGCWRCGYRDCLPLHCSDRSEVQLLSNNCLSRSSRRSSQHYSRRWNWAIKCNLHSWSSLSLFPSLWWLQAIHRRCLLRSRLW
jgi:hypothetical protein